jgi:hypothetical protein
MKKRPRLTRARLRELSHYHRKTGEFRWRKRVRNDDRVGDLAGNLYGPPLHPRRPTHVFRTPTGVVKLKDHYATSA